MLDKARAARIESLRGTVAFDELASELREAEERFWKRHISDMKAGTALDQRGLDRMLGRLDAIRLILAQPERAAKILQRAEEATDSED